ncbi:putative ribonuclease H-like domain-containing protein [Tanacetum coccineum]
MWFKPSRDDEMKVTEEPGKEGGDSSKDSVCSDQEKEDNVNNTNNVNAASINEVNVISVKSSIELPDDPNMPALEDIVYSDDDEDVGAEAGMNNVVIAIYAFSVQQRTNHKDFQNCLFACFLSQVEPKKVIQALQDPSWIEAMQDELLQFKLQKTDVKSAFLYGKIEEEVYVCQPPGFEDPDFPNRVYKVEKALYGLHQALKAWYETLSTYLLDNGFQRGKIYKTLFIRRDKGDIIKAEGGWEFLFSQRQEFVDEILIKFGFTNVKTASTPMETQNPLLKDEDGEEVDVHLYRSMIDYPFDLVAYTDSDYTGASLDRKSTTGGCQFLGSRLISRHAKKTDLWLKIPQQKLSMWLLQVVVDKCFGFRINYLIMGGGPRRQETIGDTIAQTRSDDVSKTSNDSLSQELTHLKGRYGDEDLFGVNDLEGDEVIVETKVDHEVVVETEVASKDVNLSVDEVTLDQALVALKNAKPKADKVMLQEPEQRTITTTTTATTVTTASTKTKGLKGLGYFIERMAHNTPKRLLFKLQAKKEEEERLAREKAQREEEANIVSWDNARVEADYQLAQRLQAQEQEELTNEEKARLFVQLLEARKKHFVVMRAQEIRNKPPTKEKLCRRVTLHVDMDTELMEDSEVKPEGSETRTEGSFKRAREDLQQESIKKQKVDEDKETTELQRLIEVVPDKEEVAIDAIPLATKPPSIVDWKIHKEGKKSYYQIIRADGSSKMYLVFSHMLKSFDREDLETLYKLVKAKYGSTRPVEDLDLVLYGDLKTMFDPHVEDQVWKNQSDYRVLDWKLYDSCGVHSLRKQDMHIFMLVEKRYPLTPATITKMLNMKLQADHLNEMCYQLLKLITK